MVDLDSWFEGKSLSPDKDFVSRKVDLWTQILGPVSQNLKSVLEIGSYEGRSAIFFMRFLPKSTITCVDPFPAPRGEMFKSNLEEFGDRVEQMVGFSFPALIKLRKQRRVFDLVYIDGNHRREAVMLDSILAWPMLAQNGVLIWDDYTHYKKGAPDHERVPLAVDGFLHAHPGEYSVLSDSPQMIVRKTVATPADWPDAYLTCALMDKRARDLSLLE